MELQRAEYPGMLAALSPLQATNVLNHRLRTVGKVNNDIAEWLQERRRIEEQYASSLRKLARKEPPDVESELGIFTSSWDKITTATSNLADSHHAFARRIELDVEKPLREFSTHNREMQNMSTIQGNLTSLARDFDAAQKKAEKLNQKGGRAAASKVAGASEDIDTATAQWESQAPYVFEQLQAVDESRLNHLRDVLTQYHTHEVDQVERHRGAAEQCLNALLNVNTAEEIQAFSTKNTGSAIPTEPTTSRRERRQSRLNEPPSNIGLIAPVSLRPSTNTNQASGRSPSPSAQSPENEKKRPGGLRRLGTVFNKRRQSVLPGFSRPGAGRTKSANRLGSSTDLADETVPQIPPNLDRDAASTTAEEPFSPPSGPPPERNESPPRSSTQRLEPTRSHSQPVHPVRSSSNRGLTNGTRSEAPVQSQQPTGTFETTRPQAPTHETSEADKEEDGYSTRATSNDPITQAQQEASNFEGGDASNPQLKLDIRNAPIAEEGVSADQAMANVASTLRAQAAPTRRTGTLRGRRDVRNTVFVPSDAVGDFDALGKGPIQPVAPTAPNEASAISNFNNSQSLMSSPPQAPSLPPMHRQISSTDDHASDTQSVRSGHSLVSTSSTVQQQRHPESRTPGLSSSIIETISATLSHGQVSQCTVQGELALTHNPELAASTTNTGGRGRATIRLENFPILEKVAPNPSFVSQLNPGEYAVDLGALENASGPTGTPSVTSGRPAIAFKYKLHVDPTDASSMTRHCPLLLTPSWKHEATQTSVILSYALNPAYPHGDRELTLSNVILALHLEGGRATGCQSKPAGTFSKRENLIYWRLNDLRLSAGGTQKTIARFAVEGGPATGGRCEARWEVPSSREMTRDALGVSRLEGSGVGGSGSDPFADEDGAVGGRGRWTVVEGVRRAVAGNYVAT